MIRKATTNDIESLMNLLQQVLNVHYQLRPDIFKANSTKYTKDELLEIINDNNRPIFVILENDTVVGHLFAEIIQNNGPNLVKNKTFYIDDLCIDSLHRHQGYGKELYQYARKYAKEIGCFNITLNVWCENNAELFYKELGLKPYKIGMEDIL